MMNAEMTAKNFTIKGIEGLIRHNERELVRLDEFDAQYGEAGREAREAARPRIEQKLAQHKQALKIRTEAGGE